MDQDIKIILDEQNKKIDAIYASVEKTRKYITTTVWVTVLTILVPALLLAFVLPSFLSSYTAGLTGAGQ